MLLNCIIIEFDKGKIRPGPVYDQWINFVNTYLIIIAAAAIIPAYSKMALIESLEKVNIDL